MVSLSGCHRLGERHKRSIQEMLLRAGLAAPPPHQLPYYHAPPAPQPPPRPVVPPKPPALKNLCQFPVPPIEGVGSVTVTLEDYKTLQVGGGLQSLFAI